MRNGVATILLTVATAACGCSTFGRSAAGCNDAGRVDSGTVRLSESQYYLKNAAKALETAEELFADNEHERALYMLMRAEADAALALLLSRQDDQERETQIVLERARALKNATR